MDDERSSLLFFDFPVPALIPLPFPIQLDIDEPYFNTESKSAFVDVTWSVSDRIRVGAGIRRTLEDKEEGHTFTILVKFPFGTTPIVQRCGPVLFEQAWNESQNTVRASVEYDLTDTGMVYASCSEGFKVGGVNSSDRNPPWNPETVDAYEVGYKASFAGGSTTLRAAGFKYDYSDFQVAQVIGIRGVISVEPGEPFYQLVGASIHYRIAIGPNAGRRAMTLRTVPAQPQPVASTLLAKQPGFSLYAATCRFRPRPPDSEDRNSRHSGSSRNLRISARRRGWGTLPVCQANSIPAAIAYSRTSSSIRTHSENTMIFLSGSSSRLGGSRSMPVPGMPAFRQGCPGGCAAGAGKRRCGVSATGRIAPLRVIAGSDSSLISFSVAIESPSAQDGSPSNDPGSGVAHRVAEWRLGWPSRISTPETIPIGS